MGRTALITGASSGLGAEYARQLAARGADVVLVARDRAALAALAADLTERHGVAAEVVAADLLTPEGLAAVEERLADPDRPVEMLVNSAGIALPFAFETNDIEAEVRHLHLHVEVPMRLMHAALGPMLERGHGRILNVASVSAWMPRATYGAVKAWVVSFSRWANGAYAARGVTVTAVAPGFMRTGFRERSGLAGGDATVPSWMWVDAAAVVRASLRASARGTAVTIPSVRYNVMVALSRVAPPRLVARAAARGR